jgi:hypothetical protein
VQRCTSLATVASSRNAASAICAVSAASILHLAFFTVHSVYNGNGIAFQLTT